MAISTSQAITLNLNGTEFWHYHARDSHGSGCSIFMVDKKELGVKEFSSKIREVAGPGALMIRDYLQSKYLTGGFMDPVYDQKVEVSINGNLFSQTLHSERKFGRGPQDHEINGEAVSFVDFRSALYTAIGDSKSFVWNALMTMHSDYDYLREKTAKKLVEDSPSP